MMLSYNKKSLEQLEKWIWRKRGCQDWLGKIGKPEKHRYYTKEE